MTMRQIIAHDVRLSQGLVGRVGGRHARAVAWMLARSGDSWFWLLIVAFLLWRGRALGGYLLVTVAATAFIVFVVKGIFKRQRPSESRLTIASDKYAFPSGHAARSGAVAIVLAAAYPQLTPLWLLWAVLVSMARIALSRHYLTDVLGGLMLGAFVALGLQLLK